MDKNIPTHIAIIMDGNRRWAKNHGLETLKGHQKGVDALEEVVEVAAKMGVEFLTVYALSTENLKERDKGELAGLFQIMQTAFGVKLKKMMENGVKVNVLGKLQGLPYPIKKIIEQIGKVATVNKKITLNIALNYGSRAEIIDAIQAIMKQGVDKIDEKIVESHLCTVGMPDPELVIRTGGKVRISNFLLWQTAYSELYFTPVLWPDFTPKELEKALTWYHKQIRNFGK